MTPHPMAAVIAAYLRAKREVPDPPQLFVFDLVGDPGALMVELYPARWVINVPTGGVL